MHLQRLLHTSTPGFLAQSARYFCALLVAALAALAGSAAQAFPKVTLPDVQLSGYETAPTQKFNLPGFIDFNISVDFVNLTGDDSWASDLLIGIWDPSGDFIDYGGFNAKFGGATKISTFPASWELEDNGIYTTRFLLADILALVPTFGEAGEYLFVIANGYQDSAGVQYNDLTLTFVPEPGTLALVGLGLAGLAATRRRKK